MSFKKLLKIVVIIIGIVFAGFVLFIGYAIVKFNKIANNNKDSVDSQFAQFSVPEFCDSKPVGDEYHNSADGFHANERRAVLYKCKPALVSDYANHYKNKNNLLGQVRIYQSANTGYYLLGSCLSDLCAAYNQERFSTGRKLRLDEQTSSMEAVFYAENYVGKPNQN